MFTLVKETSSGLDITSDNRYLVTGQQEKVTVVDIMNLPQSRDFIGHTDYITAVSFSRDGQYLASTSWDQTIRIWEVASGKEIKQFAVSEGCAKTLTFGPDDKIIWAGTTAGSVYRIDLIANQIQKFAQLDLEVTKIQATATCVFGGNKEGKLVKWDAATGVALTTLQGHRAEIQAMLLTADESLLFTGAMDKLMKIWNTSTLKEVMPAVGNIDEITSLAISRLGDALLSGSVDCTARLWDLQTGKQLLKFSSVNEVSAVAFASYAKKLAVADFEKIYVFNRSSGSLLLTLTAHTNRIRWLYFSDKGTLLYSAGCDGLICCWNINNGSLVWKVETGDSIESADLYEPQDTIVTGNWSGVVELWNAQTGTKIKEITKHSLSAFSVSFLPDGQIISGSEDGQIRVINPATQSQVEFTVQGLLGFKVLPDTITVAALTETKVQLWAWPTKELVGEIVQKSRPKAIATTTVFPLKVWIGNFSGTIAEFQKK